MESIELKNFWEQIKDDLISKLPENAYPWLNSLEISGYDNGTLTLVTGLNMARDILRRNYYAQILEIIQKTAFDAKDFNIIFDENAAKVLRKETEKINKKIAEINMKQQAMENLSYMQVSSNLNLKYKFENFVVGENNKFAHNVAMKVAQNPAGKYNPLFIYGGSGLGKTHLMQAIGHYTIFNNPKLKVKYTKTEDYVNDFISNTHSSRDQVENMSKFNKKYTNIDIILLDDIQFIEGKPKTADQMQHTFDSLYNKGKQIVITSDRQPRDIPKITDALRTRCEMGLMVEITPPDINTRIEILKKLALASGVGFSEDALVYVAQNFMNNVRELEGAFNKVCAYAEMSDREIDLPLTEEVLQCESKLKRIGFNEIAQVTAEYYNISVEDIKGPSHLKNIVAARQMAIYLASEITGENFVKIADFFNKKHSTVIYSYKQIKKDIYADKKLSADEKEIRQALMVI